MPIVKTFDFYDFKKEFMDYRRDNFTEEALKIIFDYLEESYLHDNFEMDTIGICCDFMEVSHRDIVQDYDVELQDDSAPLLLLKKTEKPGQSMAEQA